MGGVIYPSTVTGRCCAVGYVRIEAFPKRNCRSTWGSLNLCTMCVSEAKRCWAHSLSYWFQKTLDPNKSVVVLPVPPLCERSATDFTVSTPACIHVCIVTRMCVNKDD